MVFKVSAIGNVPSFGFTLLKARHGVARRGDRRGRLRNTFNFAAEVIPKKLRPPLSCNAVTDFGPGK